MNNTEINIGTRESPLAKWQAEAVSRLLNKAGIKSEMVFVKSEGDLNLVQPLYELGVQGVFTKSLDAALLSGTIDIAVHSYKDVPTQLADGLQVMAVLKRANPFDVLVLNKQAIPEKKIIESIQSDIVIQDEKFPFIIATSSVRRKAQWLNRYSTSTVENIRGNVNTRLEKLQQSAWHGAIFASAGLNRLGITEMNAIQLNWMLPAPAQGAIVVVCRKNDKRMLQAGGALNDEATAICTEVEKQFMRSLLGGCSTPVGAYAYIENRQIVFSGNILSEDGIDKVTVNMQRPVSEFNSIGNRAAQQLLGYGGAAILKNLRINTI